jgi:hypothetical protein
MRWTDYLAITACYALTALLAWMVIEPAAFAAYLIGVLP